MTEGEGMASLPVPHVLPRAMLCVSLDSALGAWAMPRRKRRRRGRRCVSNPVSPEVARETAPPDLAGVMERLGMTGRNLELEIQCAGGDRAEAHKRIEILCAKANKLGVSKRVCTSLATHQSQRSEGHQSVLHVFQVLEEFPLLLSD